MNGNEFGLWVKAGRGIPIGHTHRFMRPLHVVAATDGQDIPDLKNVIKRLNDYNPWTYANAVIGTGRLTHSRESA